MTIHAPAPPSLDASQGGVDLRALVAALGAGFCVIEVLLDEAGRPRDYRFLEANPAFERHTGLRDPVGRTALELVPGLERHWIDLYGAVAATGEPARFTSASQVMGRTFDVHAHRLGEPARRQVALIFEDVTERLRAEEALRAAAARERLLRRLGDATRHLADPEAVQAEAMRALCEGLGVGRATFFEVEEDGEWIVARGRHVAEHPPLPERLRLDGFGAAFPVSFREGEVVAIADTGADPRLSAEGRAAFAAIGTGAAAAVPLRRDGRLVALLALNHGRPRAWPEADLALLREVADRVWDASERARAERDLRESERRFRAVQDTSIDGFMVLEALRDGSGVIEDFRWTWANDAAARIVGRPPGWFVGRRLLREMPGNRDEGLFDGYRRVVETGKPWTSTFAYRRDGVDAHLRLVAAKVGDGFAVSFADLSESAAIADRLRLSEGRFRAAVAAVEGVLWTNDAQGRMVGEQPGWEALTGQRQGDYQGHGWTAAVHPDDVAPTVAAWEGAVAAREIFVHEHRVRRRDGAWRRFAIRAVPTLGPDGAVLEWVGLHTDVTEERAAQEALAASEARFRTAAEALPGLLFISEEGVGNTYVNEGMRRFSGLTDEDLLSDRWAMIVHPDDRIPSIARWQDAAAKGGLFEAEYRLRRHDGAWRWHAVRALPLPSEPGVPRRWVGTAIDIHDRHTAEAQLQARVAAALAEREAALAQLHEAQKTEMVGQLTGGVAHDMNNLLTPIVAGLDILRRRLLDDRDRRLVEGAQAAADRAATLVQRLLAFARRQHLEARPVDVAALLAGLADLLGRSIGPQVQVEMALAPGLPPARVDPNQLELAVLNLCVNARDAMPGGGRVRVAAGLRDVAGPEAPGLAPGPHVAVEVADEGMGMDEATLARAIEPFFSTKERGRGTGLGLSMVQGLARQSGGGLLLRSRPGEGTVATILLPLAGEAVPEPEAPVEPGAGPGARLRVLLVDDDEGARAAVAELLRELGHRVEEEPTAEAALLRLGAWRPDLLVTDYAMPGLSGLELARRARLLWPGLPALLATGFADLPEGAAPDLPRLAKPFDRAALAAALDGLAS